MGGGPVGGTPEIIACGAQNVQAASTAVASTADGLAGAGRQAEAAAGDERVTAALDRFTAAWARMSRDVGAQLHAAALLANNSAVDLSTAGGH